MLLTIVLIVVILLLLTQGRFPAQASIVEILYVILLVVLVLALLNLIPVVAHAQVAVEVTPPAPKDRWDDILAKAQDLAYVVVLAALSAAVLAARSWLSSNGLLAVKKTEVVDQSTFDQASLLALSYYETLKKNALGNGDVDWSKVGFDDPFLMDAALWMQKAWPDATKGMSTMDVISSLLARVPSGEMTVKALDLAKVKATATKS